MIKFVKGWLILVYDKSEEDLISPATAYTKEQDALDAKEIMLEDGLLEEYGYNVKVEEIVIGLSGVHMMESAPRQEV